MALPECFAAWFSTLFHPSSRALAIEAVPWWRRRCAFALATEMSARSDGLWRCKRLAFELVVVLTPTTTLSDGGPNHNHRSPAHMATTQTMQEPTGGCQSSGPKHFTSEQEAAFFDLPFRTSSWLRARVALFEQPVMPEQARAARAEHSAALGWLKRHPSSILRLRGRLEKYPSSILRLQGRLKQHLSSILRLRGKR